MSKWLAALLIAVVPAAAQQTQPAELDDSGLVLRFDVNLVQIDAVVTDRRGRRVTDLTPEDFEIRQDGKIQRITHFSYIPEEEPLAAEHLPSRPEQPSQLERAEVRRTIAILVDDYKMEFADIVRTRHALRRFVKEELRPDDMVSVLRTTLGSGALQQFSADRDYLEHVIERLQWRPPIGYVNALDYVLPQVLRAMAKFPGRKTLILVSRGPRMGRIEVDWMMDTASRSSTVIHTIYAPGVETFAITAADRRAATEILAEFRDPQKRFHSWNRTVGDAIKRQALLKLLAKVTGGLYFGGNDLDRHVVNASRDSSGYYLIGWNPGPDAFERRAGKPPAYHSLRVRVNRKGLRVRTRTGFQAVPTAPGGPDRRSDALRMREALFSPFKSGDINVQISSSFQYDDVSGPYLTSMLRVRPEGIDFKQDEHGCQIADLEVLSTPLWLDQKRIIPTGITSSQQVHMEVCGESARRVITEGFAVELRSPVEKAKAYQMRVAVRNIEPGELFSNAPQPLMRQGSGIARRPPLIGSATQIVDVPDWSRKRLTLTDLTIGAAPASLPPEGGVHLRLLYPQADPALRHFSPGDTVPYAVRVIAGKKNMPLAARLILVHEGEEAASTEAAPLQMRESYEGMFPLEESLAPGHYLLGAEVTEQSGKKKPAAAQRWIDLEIQ